MLERSNITLVNLQRTALSVLSSLISTSFQISYLLQTSMSSYPLDNLKKPHMAAEDGSSLYGASDQHKADNYDPTNVV